VAWVANEDSAVRFGCVMTREAVASTTIGDAS